MEELILKEAMDYFEEDTVYIVEVSFNYWFFNVNLVSLVLTLRGFS